MSIENKGPENPTRRNFMKNSAKVSAGATLVGAAAAAFMSKKAEAAGAPVDSSKEGTPDLRLNLTPNRDLATMDETQEDEFIEELRGFVDNKLIKNLAKMKGPELAEAMRDEAVFKEIEDYYKEVKPYLDSIQELNRRILGIVNSMPDGCTKKNKDGSKSFDYSKYSALKTKYVNSRLKEEDLQKGDDNYLSRKLELLQEFDEKSGLDKYKELTDRIKEFQGYNNQVVERTRSIFKALTETDDRGRITGFDSTLNLSEAAKNTIQEGSFNDFRLNSNRFTYN